VPEGCPDKSTLKEGVFEEQGCANKTLDSKPQSMSQEYRSKSVEFIEK
jgi:hypothetical protein